MLFLLFQLGKDRYALDTSEIVEVLPLLNFKKIPQSPACIAGVFNYHGAPVPVIDLSELALGRASEPRLSTRLLLVHHTDETGGRHLLGLIVERATETLRREPADFVPAGVTSPDAAYLGPVTIEAGRMIQKIEVKELLPESVCARLFKQGASSP